MGHSGCAVSAYALGTMTFGVEADEAEAHRQLDRFLEAGGTLVDTADTYGVGRSEEIIGRWFASLPAEITDRVVLATKGRFPLDDDAPRRVRAVRASSDPGAGRLVAAAGPGRGGPVPRCTRSIRGLRWRRRCGRWMGCAGRQGPLLRAVQRCTGWQVTKAAHLARAMNIAGPADLAAAVHACWYARSSGRSCLPPWTPGSGCCRGVRSAAAGSPASTSGTRARPGATRLGEDPSRGMEAYDRRGTERTWRMSSAVCKIGRLTAA